MTIMKDFVCNDCGHKFEDFFKPSEEDKVVCLECGSNDISRDGLSFPSLGAWSMQDKAGRDATLKKRSADHTNREVVKNADRFGAAGMARRNEILGKKK
jgi:putative FmdB family regulatory protein